VVARAGRLLLGSGLPGGLLGGLPGSLPGPGRAQRLRQFGGRGGAFQSGLAEFLLDLVEEGGVAVVGEFHLDLGPGRGAVARADPVRADAVEADLGEQGAGVVDEVADVAGRAQAYEGDEFGVADARADEAREHAGHGVGEGGPDLVAHALGDGELEVPAGVVATGAAAQGEGGGGEALVGGVVVGGVEFGDALVDDARDARDAAQVGHLGAALGGGSFVLTLDLALRVRHDPNLDVFAGRGQ